MLTKPIFNGEFFPTLAVIAQDLTILLHFRLYLIPIIWHLFIFHQDRITLIIKKSSRIPLESTGCIYSVKITTKLLRILRILLSNYRLGSLLLWKKTWVCRIIKYMNSRVIFKAFHVRDHQYFWEQ
jgi:hypothetical protein